MIGSGNFNREIVKEIVFRYWKSRIFFIIYKIYEKVQ